MTETNLDFDNHSKTDELWQWNENDTRGFLHLAKEVETMLHLFYTALSDFRDREGYKVFGYEDFYECVDVHCSFLPQDWPSNLQEPNDD